MKTAQVGADRDDPTDPENNYRTRESTRQLRQLLLAWDPIGIGGVPECDDEYDHLISPLLHQLHHGAPRSEIETWLVDQVRHGMGLRRADTDREARLAADLVSWWHRRVAPDAGRRGAADGKGSGPTVVEVVVGTAPASDPVATVELPAQPWRLADQDLPATPRRPSVDYLVTAAMQEFYDALPDAPVVTPLSMDHARVIAGGFQADHGRLYLAAYATQRAPTANSLDWWDGEWRVNDVHLESSLPESNPLWRLDVLQQGLRLVTALLPSAVLLVNEPVQAVINLQSTADTVDPETDVAVAAVHFYVLRTMADDLRPRFGDDAPVVFVTTVA